MYQCALEGRITFKRMEYSKAVHNVLLNVSLAPLKSCCLLGSFLQTEAVGCLRVLYTKPREPGWSRPVEARARESQPEYYRKYKECNLRRGPGRVTTQRSVSKDCSPGIILTSGWLSSVTDGCGDIFTPAHMSPPPLLSPLLAITGCRCRVITQCHTSCTRK